MKPVDAEIKVTVSDAAVGHAMATLGLDPEKADPVTVCFAEDVAVGIRPDTPLLKHNVVLRARQRSGDSRDDCTVKIRPCRLSQLSHDVVKASADKKSGFKLEADWTGASRVLAASFTVDLNGHPVTDAVADQRPLSELMSKDQADFLRECADVPVNLALLTLLPRTVNALRWKAQRFDGSTTKSEIRAEQWKVGVLNFLEFSIVAPIEDSVGEQAALGSFLESRGIHVPEQQVTKTQLVLAELVGITDEANG